MSSTAVRLKKLLPPLLGLNPVLSTFSTNDSSVTFFDDLDETQLDHDHDDDHNCRQRHAKSKKVDVTDSVVCVQRGRDCESVTFPGNRAIWVPFASVSPRPEDRN